jgi:hypothetical protein
MMAVNAQSLRVKGDMTKENYDVSCEHPTGSATHSRNYCAYRDA